MPLLLPPQIVNVEWGHVTQRLILPADWRELSEEDKHKVPLIQIRGYLPREFKLLPDWAIWGMTFAPGFALMSDLTVATGSGARVKTVYFLTSGTTVTVPADWNSAVNTIECLGGGSTGIAGAHGSAGSSVGGRGGGAGGGGAYVKSSNIALAPSSVTPIQVGIANGTAVTGSTWFVSTSTVFAKAGAAGSSQTGGIGGTTDESIGDVKFAGGGGGGGASASIHGGAGGGGGGGGYISQNGSNGIPGADRSGGAGGASGPTAAGAAGTIWTQTSPSTTGGPGGGGGGGGGGKGNSGVGDPGGVGIAGGLYGSGGGGGGGGGCGETHFDSLGNITGNSAGGNGGAGGAGKAGIIVVTNNSDL